MKTVRTVIGGALLLSLCACESPSEKEDTFSFETPTWCLASLEHNEEGEFSQLLHLQYDEDGNWIQTDWDFRNNGSIDARTLREFEGGFLKAESFQRLHLEKVDWRVKYDRDSAGQILRYAEESSRGSEVFVRINSWDGDMLLRSDYDRDADGRIDDYQVFFYENGVVMGNKAYDAANPNSEAVLTDENFYEGDLLIRTTRVRKDGSLVETIFFEYDEFDRLILMKKVNDETQLTVWSFDEQGRLAESVEKRGEESFRYVYSYDCDEEASTGSVQFRAAPGRGSIAKSASSIELGAGRGFSLQ